jgi:hypothetical protein
MRLSKEREMKVVQFTVMTLSLVALMGCISSLKGIAEPTKDALDFAVRDYSTNVRWANTVKVLGHVSREDRPVMMEVLERMGAYHMSDYEIGVVDILPDKESASAMVVYTGYSEKNLIVIEIIEDQEWYWDDKIGKWRLRPSVDSFIFAK